MSARSNHLRPKQIQHAILYFGLERLVFEGAPISVPPVAQGLPRKSNVNGLHCQPSRKAPVDAKPLSPGLPTWPPSQRPPKSNRPNFARVRRPNSPSSARILVPGESDNRKSVSNEKQTFSCSEQRADSDAPSLTVASKPKDTKFGDNLSEHLNDSSALTSKDLNGRSPNLSRDPP